MRLRITYDGPALDNHEMDVRDLAPSLLALADLFDDASRVLFDGHVKPSMQVRASFRTGSFGIDLSVSTLSQILDLFSHPALSGAGVLVGLVGGVFGLVAILRKMAGRSVSRVERSEDKGLVIILNDGDILPIEQAVLRLLESPSVIEQLGKVLDPLKRDGIMRVAFGDDESIKEIVEKEELPFFAPLASAQEVPLTNERRTMVFSPVSVSFKENNKWRMSDGQNGFYVAMEDPAFLQKVTEGEPFAKSDLLICEVEIRQWQTTTGLRTEYAIVKVLEHRQSAQQMSFPFNDTTPKGPSENVSEDEEPPGS